MNLEEFIAKCTPQLTKVAAMKMADEVVFTTQEWVKVYEASRQSFRVSDYKPQMAHRSRKRCFLMQVIAIRKAIEVAVKLEDWQCILGAAKSGNQKTLAYGKVQELSRASTK